MRNLLFLSLVFFVFSCKQNEEKVIISESNSANNEKVAKELFIHFNNHDWRKMANLYSEKEFWSIWNKKNYDFVKNQTDPDNIFMNLYDKMCRASKRSVG